MRSQHTTDQGKRDGVIFGRNNNIKLLKNGDTPTIEYPICRYTIRKKRIHIIGIYHPTPNGEHNTTNGIFIDDITELLVYKLPQYQNSIILGDFNIHIEDLTNADAVISNDTMRALGLKQHISGSTRVKGNTLDLIFTQLSIALTSLIPHYMDSSQITVWSQSTST